MDFIPHHSRKSCARGSLQSPWRNQRAASLLPSRNAPGTEGGTWGGLGVQGTITNHRACGSGLLALPGVLRLGHYPLMASQGQRFVKPAGSPSPVLPTAKLFLLIGHLLIKAGEEMCTRDRGPKVEKGLRKVWTRFNALLHGSLQPIRSCVELLCCPCTPCSLSPLTLPKNTSQKGLKGSGTGKHLGRG